MPYLGSCITPTFIIDIVLNKKDANTSNPRSSFLAYERAAGDEAVVLEGADTPARKARPQTSTLPTAQRRWSTQSPLARYTRLRSQKRPHQTGGTRKFSLPPQDAGSYSTLHSMGSISISPLFCNKLALMKRWEQREIKCLRLPWGVSSSLRWVSSLDPMLRC